MPVEIKYVAIDSNIGVNKDDLHLVEDICINGDIKGKKILLLQFSKDSGEVKKVLESYFDFETIHLENKANSSDIKSIFEYFSAIEGTNITKIEDKIKFGKKILYLDAVSSSFIRRFGGNQECPGFWNLAVGTFCRHRCQYCFLNLTMRVRPLCVEHMNLSRLKSNLKYFNKKYGHPNALLNSGETSDPLDNEPILHLWNKIVELVQESGNQLLCLTKSNYVDSIPESNENNLKESVIYSWSINPPAIVRRYELDTASSSERLEAARHIKDFGYRVRFRIDPILPLNLMESISNSENLPLEDIELSSYFELIDQFDRIEPEMVTFGTFRALPPLFNFLKDRTLKKDNFIKNGKRFRLPRHYRQYIYEKLGNYAQDLLGCNIGICKDPSIDLPFSTFKAPCQCMKIWVLGRGKKN